MKIAGVVDIRAASILEKLGLTSEQLAADDHDACQMVGGAAAYVDIGALLVPSARYAGGANLVIFTRNQEPDFQLEIEGRESVPLR